MPKVNEIHDFSSTVIVSEHRHDEVFENFTINVLCMRGADHEVQSSISV